MRLLYKARLSRGALGRKERGQLFVLGLASIYDGLITVLSLGYYATDLRSWLLFDYFEE